MNTITELLDLEDADISISDISIDGTKKYVTLETPPQIHFCPACGFRMHEEAVSYIIHKLECAGAARTVIDEAAMRAVAGHAHGNPRLIDNIMNDAVTIGAQSNKTTIDTEVILAAVNNQNLG